MDLNKERNMGKEKMIEILENNKISKCTEEEKKQIFEFAFGEDFMTSKDKGRKKTYKEENG
tara:strand:+ start:76 stop:258 length:183 start_codon:yes stop_codon:yes gene_type:complete